MPRGARIILATIGTLGDLHPFIAIGLALKARGHHPLLAVPEDHVAKARATGLDAEPILPSFETVRQRIGLPEAEAVKKVMADQRYMLEQVLMPWLQSSTVALDALAGEADCLVNSLFVFGAATIAEKRGLPLVSVLLQPMALVSPHRPPHTPDFWMLRARPKSAAALGWNKLVFAAARAHMRRRYGPAMNALQSAHGLPPWPGKSFFDVDRRAALTLGCYSPLFGPLPPDAPRSVRITGFPTFDAGACDAVDPELDAFLAAGPPPLVFTLGSFAVFAPGDFYREAIETSQLLGRRAILLTGPGSDLASSDTVLVRDYVPHSRVFPRAAAIVHHGGVGTTGQALRAGKPQLIVPHMGDQWDNGERVRTMGVGRWLSAKRFAAPRAAKRIGALLNIDRGYAARAAHVGDTIAAEHGAESAAEAIESVLDSRR